MDNTKFTKLAEQTISLLAEAIELQDKECFVDIDFQGDILTLTTDQGVFVINKHAAAKEIWLSSPISGPHHFCYSSGRWKSKTNNDLILILEQELKLNNSIQINSNTNNKMPWHDIMENNITYEKL